MVGSLIGLVRDIFFSLSGVFDGIVEGILGSVNELGERFFKLLDRLVLGRELFKEGFWGSVRFNGYLTHDLLVRDNEGGGESRKRQDLDELHDNFNMVEIVQRKDTIKEGNRL